MVVVGFSITSGSEAAAELKLKFTNFDLDPHGRKKSWPLFFHGLQFVISLRRSHYARCNVCQIEDE